MTSTRRSDPAAKACAALAIATAALVLLPIGALALMTAGGSDALAHLAGTVFVPALVDTLLLLAGTGLVAGVLGTAAAVLVTAFRFPGRDLLAVALVLPLAIPSYVAAYVAVELLDPLGPVQGAFRALTGYRSKAEYWFPETRSLPGAVLVLGFVLYPYVYLAVRALLATRSAALSDVARTLGAGPWRNLVRVVLPLARPGLVAGVTLVLLETLNDIGASEYLGVRTLTVAVFDTWLNRGSLAGAAQIACLMLAVVVLVIGAETRLRGDRRYNIAANRPRIATAIRLAGWKAAAATLATTLPVLIGFVAPAGFLVGEAARQIGESGIPAGFVAQAMASAGYAVATTALAVMLGSATVLAVRLIRSRTLAAAARIGTLGYALPGTVLALGLLGPLAAFDNALSRLSGALFGLGPALFFIGSGAALVLALTARFVSIAIGGVGSGLERVSTRMDDAAASLGAARQRLIGRVLLPLARPALAGAAILVFVDAVKELPATLLLRPLGIDTLATALYGQASRGRFEDGALAALAIVAVGLVPVLRLSRAMDMPRSGAETGRGAIPQPLGR